MDSKPLEGRIAIVTGASKGIGRACAELLAAHGAAVVVNYAQDGAAAEEVVRVIAAAGGRAVAAAARIEQADGAPALFAQANRHFGQPHILVCNAGIASTAPLAQSTEAEFDRIYGVNVKGLLFLLREAATGLADNGRIVTLSSTVAVFPRADTTLYASSKAAVRAMTEVASVELGPRGITVNSVLPGLVDTPMVSRMPAAMKQAVAAASPFGRIGVPDDIAGIVAFLASDAARWITGQSIVASGGARR